MKIAVIGGGGVRTPLLVQGLTASDLPIREIGLYDVDQARLSAIAPLAQSYSPLVRPYADAGSCVNGASYVFLSIRVGGAAARARDEATAVEHGTVGQETVGPAGFAMAVRTAPVAVEYARLVAQHAPRAWIINFTNPVSIVTQAITTMTGARTIGICDTPTELFEDVAQVLGLDSARCHFDYFGLNHLGWLRDVYVDGESRIGDLWTDPERLRRIYRAPLFDPAFLQRHRLLPTEYLFYYYFPDAALENIRKAGGTRGQTVARLNDALFRELTNGGSDPRAVYERYIAERNVTYMQIESGAGAPLTRSPWADLTGYDKIALSVVRAIHFNSNAIIPLDVPNRGTLDVLGDDDVVEVPCAVNSNGAHPLNVARIPEHAASLVMRVKAYERATIEAAVDRSAPAAARALALNPLVSDGKAAARLVDALQPLW